MRGNTKSSAVIQVATMILPWQLRRMILNALLHYKISRGAYIGYSIVMADNVAISEGARIGHLNIVKGMSNTILEAGAKIGNLNWITGMPADNPIFFREEPDRISTIILGEGARIGDRNLFDCSNKVSIGRFSVIEGVRSQFITHSIDIGPCRQTTRPIDIGDYCVLGTGSIVLKGAVLSAHSWVADGSMLRGQFYEQHLRLGGNPAKPVAATDRSAVDL